LPVQGKGSISRHILGSDLNIKGASYYTSVAGEEAGNRWFGGVFERVGPRLGRNL
jgi:hypothetical protein